MLVGLTGVKMSGKDTVGSYLVKQHSFQRKSFADPLKRSVAALLDIPFSEVDLHKLEENCYVTLGYKNEPSHHEQCASNFGGPCDCGVGSVSQMWSPSTELTFREFLQRYGTESHREVFGENFWVDQTLPVGGYYAGRAIVITDVRFKSEAERIKELGGLLVKVVRPSLGENTDPHPSEVEMHTLLTHHTIFNTGTIEDLFKQVEEALVTLSWLESVEV